MPGDPLEAQKIHIGCVKRDILEVTAQNNVSRVTQRDQHSEFGEDPQPNGQPRRRGGVLVHQQFVVCVLSQILLERLDIEPAQAIESSVGKVRMRFCSQGIP